MLRLRLSIAERLCTAPDYADQAVGLDVKTRTLRDLALMGELLPVDERRRLQAAWDAHRHRSERFPRSQRSWSLTKDGLASTDFPDLGETLGINGRSGYVLTFTSEWATLEFRSAGRE